MFVDQIRECRAKRIVGPRSPALACLVLVEQENAAVVLVVFAELRQSPCQGAPAGHSQYRQARDHVVIGQPVEFLGLSQRAGPIEPLHLATACEVDKPVQEDEVRAVELEFDGERLVEVDDAPLQGGLIPHARPPPGAR